VKSHLDQILERRACLVAAAELQRGEIARFYRRLQRPVQIGERVAGYVKLFKSPVFVVGLSAILWKTRWKKFARIPAWVWKGLQFARVIQGVRSAAS